MLNATNDTCSGWNEPENANGTVGIIRNDRLDQWTNGSLTPDPGCRSTGGGLPRHLYCFEQLTPSSTGEAGCLTAYQDFDDDGFTLGGAKYFCGLSQLPYGYKASPSSQLDCYDLNPNAKPGQTGYFDQNRGDGSFDYNCDEQVMPNYRYSALPNGDHQIYQQGYVTLDYPSCQNNIVQYTQMPVCIGYRETLASDCGTNKACSAEEYHGYDENTGLCGSGITRTYQGVDTLIKCR